MFLSFGFREQQINLGIYVHITIKLAPPDECKVFEIHCTVENFTSHNWLWGDMHQINFGADWDISVHQLRLSNIMCSTPECWIRIYNNAFDLQKTSLKRRAWRYDDIILRPFLSHIISVSTFPWIQNQGQIFCLKLFQVEIFYLKSTVSYCFQRSWCFVSLPLCTGFFITYSLTFT